MKNMSKYQVEKDTLQLIYQKLDDIDTFLEWKFSENTMTMADFFAVAKSNFEVLELVHRIILDNEKTETGA